MGGGPRLAKYLTQSLVAGLRCCAYHHHRYARSDANGVVMNNLGGALGGGSVRAS